MICVYVIGAMFSNFYFKGILHFHILVERGKYCSSNKLWVHLHHCIHERSEGAMIEHSYLTDKYVEPLFITWNDDAVTLTVCNISHMHSSIVCPFWLVWHLQVLRKCPDPTWEDSLLTGLNICLDLYFSKMTAQGMESILILYSCWYSPRVTLLSTSFWRLWRKGLWEITSS